MPWWLAYDLSHGNTQLYIVFPNGMKRFPGVFFIVTVISASLVNSEGFFPKAHAFPLKIKGASVTNAKLHEIDLQEKRGTVIIFLSAVCPCSDSHLPEIKQLAAEFSDFQFLGIHSNLDEDEEVTKKYFSQASLPFPVLQDENQVWANEWKALKTPHAFVLLKNGNLAYQGGVSSSQRFSESVDKKYLRLAIQEITEGKSVSNPEGRTLGCIIARKK